MRRALRDVVALSALPAVWGAMDSEGVIESLGGVLLATLDLQLVVVVVTSEHATSHACAYRKRRLSPEEAACLLEAARRYDEAAQSGTFRDPLQGDALRASTTRFSFGSDSGLVHAASHRPDFPTQEERMLLGVAANQAAAALYRRRTEEQLKRLLERETSRAELLARVADVSTRLNASLSLEQIRETLAKASREVLGAREAEVVLVDSGAAAGATVADGDGTAEPFAGSRLAVPLVTRAGKALGELRVSGKPAGFDNEDEAVLTQLALVGAASMENARLYERVRAQDKRKDEFLATLAHELRNPLAPLRSGLAVIAKAQTLEATVPIRQIMERQVGHMVRLIDDLLDVSRITSGKIRLRLEPLEVKKVLEAAVEVSRPFIEAARHTLDVHLPAEPLWVEADLTRLSQVVSNLLNNAAKYTAAGGRIELLAERVGEHVRIRVTDNGDGLAPDMIPEVFELFAQAGRPAESAQGGLGIGLALVKRLVELHGGTVDAESPGLGRGSTFTITLAARAPRAEPAAQLPAVREPPSAALRVMVVDDNTDAAATLSMLLEISGHQVRTSRDGAQALAALAEFSPDVVFLDIGLPGLDGYEVARRMRQSSAGAGLRIVALTGWGAESDRKRSMEAGFDRHLTKPVGYEQVQSVLHDVAEAALHKAA